MLNLANINVYRLKTLLSIIFLSLFLYSCNDIEPIIPEGFELINSNGPYHFVYMDKKFAGDKMEQRRAGNAICRKMKTVNYCEVHFWIDKKDVQTSMPIIRTPVRNGVYYLTNGKVRLKALK